jgi:lipopolysaccharide transport system permease protein
MYLYDYRELIINLVVSDLKMKYANSVLGFAWSMINPLAIFSVLFFVFHNVFSDQVDFATYLLIGIVAWRFFSIGTINTMFAIVGKSSLVTKIYLPREILVLSVAVSNMISSTLEFIVLVPLTFIITKSLHPTLLLFPVIEVLFFMIIFGLGLLLSSLYVYYRDLNQIWEVAIQAGFFVCPIVYPMSYIPAEYHFVYSLNPVTRIIEMYRDIFIYGTMPTLSDYLVVAVSGIVLILIGSITFKRLSRRFAEVV